MKYYQTTYINMNMTNADVNDSKLINLSIKSQVKPASVQDRILRRMHNPPHTRSVSGGASRHR